MSSVIYGSFGNTLTAGTAVATTSGTAIDFTGIPSWVKRITVMFNGVSTNGTSVVQVQIGSGSFTVSDYNASSTSAGGSVATTNSTTGFPIYVASASGLISGHLVLTLISGNSWISSSAAKGTTAATAFGGGDVSISGTLDRIRITTVNGTDTFDAGSINILYE